MCELGGPHFVIFGYELDGPHFLRFGKEALHLRNDRSPRPYSVRLIVLTICTAVNSSLIRYCVESKFLIKYWKRMCAWESVVQVRISSLNF